MAFIFYDCETTGADRCFDQILQFAAVRTDDDFNVLDRFEIRSRLLPHIVPSPGAMLVTGVDVDRLFDPLTPSHFKMAKRIHEVMSDWSPATIVGYNSISFDEEMLRRAFYSSLLPIYLSNTGGNSRLDILPLAVATHAFAPDALAWPINEKGRISFKLDQLAPLNGYQHDNAHDALDDVFATIHLARLIRERAPVVWNAAMEHRSKAAAIELVEREPVFVATHLRFGLHASKLVTALGVNPSNTGEALIFDLGHNPEPLATMSDDELTEFVSTKPKPISSIKLNASPIFVPVDVAGPQIPSYQLGINELMGRAALVRENQNLCERLMSIILANRTPFPESPHVEEQIYGGFYSREDQALIDEFHRADWAHRLGICDRFTDPRLRTLSRRLVFCEAPDVMPEGMRRDYARAIASRINARTTNTGKWLTIEEAIDAANELILDCPPNRGLMLRAHLDHLSAWREKVRMILDAGSVSV
jgi:exodeoxyribonuclease-1